MNIQETSFNKQNIDDNRKSSSPKFYLNIFCLSLYSIKKVNK